MPLPGQQDISTDIITDFNTNIATPESLSFRVENDSRDNPTDSLWAKLQVREYLFEKISYNQEEYNSSGFFTVQLFQKLGKGTKGINELATLIRNQYNDSYINNYIFMEKAEIVTIGKHSNNEGVFQVNVVATYRAEIFE